MNKAKTIAGAIVAALFTSAAAGHAEVLTQVFNNGTTTLLSAGDTDIATTLPGATTLASVYSFNPDPFPIFSITPAGSITSWALTGDANNPFGAGDLTLVYLLTDFNTPVNMLALQGFNVGSVYMGFNGSGVAPFDANLYSGVLSVNFANVITSGEISDYLYVYTAATLPSGSSANAINSSGAMVSNGAQILAPVPEPSSLVMLLGGIACLGLVLKHRRTAHRA